MCSTSKEERNLDFLRINLIILLMEGPIEIPSAFQEAYEKFIRSVHPAEAARFENLTIEDIRETARTIETSQGTRRSLRNLRRIEPLLEALGKYGKTLDVLCNQTPYLAFVWVGALSLQSLWYETQTDCGHFLRLQSASRFR
jgi:hypothetical protein